eukprot:1624506-Amphidinium_carterae.1
MRFDTGDAINAQGHQFTPKVTKAVPLTGKGVGSQVVTSLPSATRRSHAKIIPARQEVVSLY